MTPTLLKKSTVGLLILPLAISLTACGKKEEPATNATAASVAEAAPAMSAAPADSKGTPVLVNETNATVDAGPDSAANTATATASEVAVGASNVSPEEAMDGGADNSGMEKISENDQVIDDQPASPNAPQAAEEGTAESHQPKAVSNGKVGQ